MDKLKLRKGWVNASIDELILFALGGDWGKDENYPDTNYQLAYCIRGSEIKNWDIDKGKTALLRKIKTESLESRKLLENDILVEISGGGPEQPVGRTILIDRAALNFESAVPKVCTNFLRLIRPANSMNSKYVNFYLKHFYATGEIVKYQGGSNNLRNLRFGDYLKIELPVPPINEQEKIVSKIEELFSDLENGKTQLETSLQQLKVYRQALIKFAFEGKLTEKWRKRQTKLPDAKKLLESIQKERIKRAKENDEKPKKIKSLTREQIARLQKIPKGWKWCRNEELLDYTTSGSRDWKKYYNKTGSLFIRTQDIKTNSLVLENVARVKLPKNVEGKRSLVEINDLLMTITGANVGKVARVDHEIREAYVSQSVALMKFIDKRISPFMFYYFQARDFGGTFIEKMVYGVGRQVLSLENMRDVPVCICSVREQNKIIQELESRLSVCDKLEEIISKSIKQSESLKQSILQKAFEGKLVEQNPNDESAEILLERIKKERAEFLLEEKRRKKETPRTLKINDMAAQLKSILQLLQKSKKPISAHNLWKSSEHNEDIDAFYAQLKEHIDKGEIKELPRKGKEAYLTATAAK